MLYLKLRGAITERGYQIADLVPVIDKCPSAVSLRMCGHIPFSLPEAYAILDFLGIPYTELPTYFPPNGHVGVNRLASLASA